MGAPGGLVRPVKLGLEPGAGRLEGSNGRYEKFLTDMRGVYRDSDAFEAQLAASDGRPAYWVESHDSHDGDGGLITGVSVLEPGCVGDEYVVTRGHLHRKAESAEIYVRLAGKGVMLLESVEGDSVALKINPGEVVYVPGYWLHRSVNGGPERLATLFSYGCEAGQDYAIIERAHGMQQLVVATPDGGWTIRPNPQHRGYGA